MAKILPHKDKQIKIGIVVVDSGQLLICDPCRTTAKTLQYDNLLQDRENAPNELYMQVNNDFGVPGTGVVFNSGRGDGTYEVWATIGPVDGWPRIKSIEMNLILE